MFNLFNSKKTQSTIQAAAAAAQAADYAPVLKKQVSIIGQIYHPEFGGYYVKSYQTFIDAEYGVVSAIFQLFDYAETNLEFVMADFEQFSRSGGEVSVWNS